jgi:hypothetical protein
MQHALNIVYFSKHGLFCQVKKRKSEKMLLFIVLGLFLKPFLVSSQGETSGFPIGFHSLPQLPAQLPKWLQN